MSFNQAGNVAAQGYVAQQVFWYTAFTADYTWPGSPMLDEQGLPRWRVAPSPRGAYWQEGMKSGYQDVGAWTFLKNTPLKRLQAAWLYAQFTVAKSVPRKTLVGLTPIRQSDLDTPAMLEAAPRLGGLVEFYRSRAARRWTPTGANVPDVYAGMASLWWRHGRPALAARSVHVRRCSAWPTL